ncbi:MAG: RIP metalloprotease RseP, partial [Anaerolineae bacterium]|nr:RIP metalloprotease RseP [Anaerolineae bacterium]
MGFLELILAFGVVLVPLIIIHEFGHFLACKSVGITVLEFGLGFPPRLFKLFNWGETEFTINAIPLGGFVMPYGEDIVRPQTQEAVAEQTKELIGRRGIENPKSVFEAKPWQKLWFLFAGPFANFVAAYVVFVIVALIGLPTPKSDVTVMELFDDTPAAQLLQEGDVITRLNGKSFDTSYDLDDMLGSPTEPIILTIQREGQTQEITLTPQSAVENLPEERVQVYEIQPDTPAEEAGLQDDDIFLAVNGELILNLEQLQNLTNEHANREMMVTILRDEEMLEIPVTPRRLQGEDRARMGFRTELIATVPELGFVVDDRNVEFYNDRTSFLGAFEYATDNYVTVIEQIVSLPSEFLAGNLSSEETRLVGPVGVSQIGRDLIKNYPYQQVIVFVALI